MLYKDVKNVDIFMSFLTVLFEAEFSLCHFLNNIYVTI